MVDKDFFGFLYNISDLEMLIACIRDRIENRTNVS